MLKIKLAILLSKTKPTITIADRFQRVFIYLLLLMQKPAVLFRQMVKVRFQFIPILHPVKIGCNAGIHRRRK